MIHFLCGLCLGSVVAFFIFCLFYGSADHGVPYSEVVEPVPCRRNMPQRTIKDWLLKLDEECDEFKQEVLRHYELDDDVSSLNVDAGFRVAEEGADVSTVIASIEHAIGIGPDTRRKAQGYVNQHNARRGRL